MIYGTLLDRGWQEPELSRVNETSMADSDEGGFMNELNRKLIQLFQKLHIPI